MQAASCRPHLVLFLLLSLSAIFAVAQSTNGSTPTPSASTFLSLTTANVTVATTIRNGNQNVPTSTVIQSVFNVTLTATPTAGLAVNTSTPPPTSTAEPIHLHTHVDGAFGVLGALLILTGLPSAFLGHKNRWTSFFLIGFYTLSLVCLVLILKFGVLPAINPPNKTIRGLFVLACGVAGIAGGGIAIFFWKAAKYFIGAWGGFVFALWIQCFKNGGLVTPIGFRWLMYIACGVVGFVMCTIPQLHYYVLLISTAFVGATSFILGVDCYTTADLKEFYIWNLGFEKMFQPFVQNNIKFPVSQTMQIELGLMGAIALMGMAVQFRVLVVLQRKLKEIKEEQRRQDEAAVAKAAERFASLEEEKEKWNKDHPSLGKHGRNDSAFTSTTLNMAPDEKRESVFTLVGGPRQRYQSGVSDFMAAPQQSPGALPALDLGTDIETDVPQTFMASDEPLPAGKEKATLSTAELEDLKKKEALLAEIQTIRRSIDILKSETPAPSSSSESRHPSLTSRRTLSHDLSSFSAGPSHLRPPRANDPRGRAQSMELSRATDLASSIGRPVSTPLNEDWDSYVYDRKLLQPPSGVSAPITTTPISPAPRIAVSPAVMEALAQRHRRESSLSFGNGNVVLNPAPRDSMAIAPPTPIESSSEDAPIASSARPAHHKSHSHASNIPMTILPPRKVTSPTVDTPESPRVMTYEELAERHRQKLREMQEPLTRAEKEQAEILEAKTRWERANALEKLAVTKRQAEQAAAITKEAKKKRDSGKNDESRARSVSPSERPRPGEHTRSLSADILGNVAGGSSKRMSMLKVEDWQRHLPEPEATPVSRSKRRSGVPFPDSGNRHSRQPSGRHDPPS
ncbi:hypothetical protein C8Q75DRAFT_242333 [Abortiporus biennis]|nr:hypothetical protein C8Q75DRAFT_242333 [Abortiporus biennis]